MKKIFVLITFVLMSQFLTACAQKTKIVDPIASFSERRMEVEKKMTMKEVVGIMKEDPDQIISSNNSEVWIYEHVMIEENHANMKRLQSFNVRFSGKTVDYIGYFSCYIPLQF